MNDTTFEVLLEGISLPDPWSTRLVGSGASTTPLHGDNSSWAGGKVK